MSDEVHVITVRKGGVPCSSDCPFYTEEGVVQGVNGPIKTHCQGIMQDVVVDCHVYNPCTIMRGVTDEDTLRQIAGKLHLKRIRKLYPKNHKEIHPVGWCPKAKRINRRLGN